VVAYGDQFTLERCVRSPVQSASPSSPAQCDAAVQCCLSSQPVRTETVRRLEPPQDKDFSAYKKPLQTLDSGENISYVWDSDLPSALLATLQGKEDKKVVSRLESELKGWTFEPLTVRVSNIDGPLEEPDRLTKLLSVYGRVIHTDVQCVSAALAACQIVCHCHVGC
jgi:hypothetical protein